MEVRLLSAEIDYINELLQICLFTCQNRKRKIMFPLGVSIELPFTNYCKHEKLQP